MLGSPSLTTVWANGIYDLFVLKHREGWEVNARVEDVQILWHATYPELAGKEESAGKSHKVTRKSLAFLASLATYDPWWKGVYETEEEFLIYNGKDCAITLDVWNWMQAEARLMQSFSTYAHERDLMWPCVDMLARGLRVDDALRTERVQALSDAYADVQAELDELVVPFLEANREKLEALDLMRLFEETEGVCECCRHASKKQHACWSCAGFDSAPSKKQLMSLANAVRLKGRDEMLKAELEEALLGTCAVCEGRERRTTVSFNPQSVPQKTTVLYDLLKFPERRSGGSLTTDEETLKNLLSTLPSTEPGA